MVRNAELNAWRRRLRTARQLAEMLASGRRVWLDEDAGGTVLYGSPLDHGPGVVVYDLDRGTGLFAVRYRIIGLALADSNTH